MGFFTGAGKTYQVTGSDIDAWLDYAPPGDDIHDPGQSNKSAEFSLSGSRITVVEQCRRVEEGYLKGDSQRYASYEVVKVTVEGRQGEYFAWVVYEGVLKVEEYTPPVQPPEPESKPETQPGPEPPEPPGPGPQPGPEPPEPPTSQPGDVQIEVHAGQTVVVEVKSTSTVAVEPSIPDVIGSPPPDDWFDGRWEASTYGGHGQTWGLSYDIRKPSDDEVKSFYPGVVEYIHHNPPNYYLWNEIGANADARICILSFADRPSEPHLAESEEECSALAQRDEAQGKTYISYIEQKDFDGYGNYVLIANHHPPGGVSAYCHVFGITVKEGQVIQAGTTIAKTGGANLTQSTDRSTLATRDKKNNAFVYDSPFGPCGTAEGSHLHYEGRYDDAVRLFSITYDQFLKKFPNRDEEPEWVKLFLVDTSDGWTALQRSLQSLFAGLGFALGSNPERLRVVGDGVQLRRCYFKDRVVKGISFDYCLELTDGERKMEGPGPVIPWTFWKTISCYAKGQYRFK